MSPRPLVRSLTALTFCALAAAFGAAAPAHAEPFGSVGAFGSAGIAADQFMGVESIAVGGDGTIYVLDRRGSQSAAQPGFAKIKRFTKDGVLIDGKTIDIKVPSDSGGAIFRARDIALDESLATPVLYVSFTRRVSNLDPESTLERPRIYRIPLPTDGVIEPESAVVADRKGTVTWVTDNGTPATDPSTAANLDDLYDLGAIAVDPSTHRVYVGGTAIIDPSTTVPVPAIARFAPSGDGSSATMTKVALPSALRDDVGDLGFRGDKLYVLGPAATEDARGRVITLSGTLGATGDTALTSEPSNQPTAFDGGGRGRGMALEPGGGIVLNAIYDNRALGAIRFTGLAGGVDKIWGNVPGAGTCEFSGTGGLALAYNPVSSEWLLGDGGNAQTPLPTGSSVPRRVQRFKEGSTDTSCGFAAGSATISPSIGAPKPGQNVTFTPNITAPTRKPATDITPTAYDWKFDEGDNGSVDATSTQASPSRALPRGITRIKLQITFSDGSKSAETSITLDAKSTPPSNTTLTASPASARTGDTVTFTGAASGVDGATIATYEFDFDGDGTYDTAPSASPTATHVYGTARTYVARVRVTDNLGASSTATRSVTISAPATNPPSGGGDGGGGGGGGGNVGGQGNPPGGGTTPSDKTAPKLSVKGGKLAVKKYAFALTLACPANETSCTITVKVVTAGKKPVTLGTGTIKLAGGKSGKLTLKLNAAGKKALKKKTAKVQLQVSAADAAGNAATQTTSATLKR